MKHEVVRVHGRSVLHITISTTELMQMLYAAISRTGSGLRMDPISQLQSILIPLNRDVKAVVITASVDIHGNSGLGGCLMKEAVSPLLSQSDSLL